MKLSHKLLAPRILLSLVVIMATVPASAGSGGRGQDCAAPAAGGAFKTKPAAGGCGTVRAAVQPSAHAPSAAALQQASPLTTTTTIYLPLVAKPAPPGLYGRVTLNGAPDGGVSLQLWRSDFNLIDFQNTAADGAYAFIGEPALAGGKSYYVLFNNGAFIADDRVKYWLTRFVSSYAAGQSVAIGNFDLADSALLSPTANVTVTLPTTFTWTTRAGINSDSYQMRLFRLNVITDTAHYSTPLLGYVGAYQLNSLPAGFSPNIQYDWEALLNSPDGGVGGSFVYRNITFSNSGQSARPPVTSDLGPERLRVLERLFR